MTTMPLSEKQDMRPFLALTLAALFWSGNFIAGKILGGTVSPTDLNTIRWVLSLLMLAPFATKRTIRHWPEIKKAWRLIALLGLTGVALFHTMVYQALTLTSAVNALLILSLAPVATIVGGILWNGYRPNLLQTVGVLISVLGAAVLVLFSAGGGEGASWKTPQVDAGTLWMIGAILVWAAYSLLLRRRPKELPQDVTLMTSIVAGLIVMVPLTLVFGLKPFALTRETGAAIFYIALFASLLGFLLWSFGLSRIGPERAGQFVHLMPVFGTLMAVVFLGETFSAVHAVGAALAVSGILLTNRKSRQA